MQCRQVWKTSRAGTEPSESQIGILNGMELDMKKTDERRAVGEPVLSIMGSIWI